MTTKNHGEEKVIGIVGGMGPHAGAALFNGILRNTRASTDQQHLSAILMSFPGEIVDRTLFLEGKTTVNPAFRIVKVIKKLEAAGAELVGIACNTCHALPIYDVIMEELDKINSPVKMINMPVETCRTIAEKYYGARRVGVMATNGTYKSGLYRRLLREWGFDIVQPRAEFQNDIIHRMIYDPEFGIKAQGGFISSQVQGLMEKAIDYFKEQDTDAIILGCTELSLTVTGSKIRGIQMVDSTECLARALVKEATLPVFAEA